MKALVLTLLFILVAANEAKVYSKCELASRLKQSGIDGYYGFSLGDWICMAYYQSRYNSRFLGPQTSDGNREYGIFQISSRWWCNNYQGPTANGCNRPCSAFLTDNIAADIACAKRIVRDPAGMNAWAAWKKYCKGKNLSQWTSGCRL
ncbi:lysozyme C, milk isozyme-like [Protobothrops mucrosquamatus]|uniref:lysozyme C, milk isozyme-like n=1 Tax=Protobothrops mucrosquamatus TaxID=103944 RepID=UPI0010FAE599|nr:lysozyme C, milk isozyme-like [Protobothrops mucrosquamatus]